MAMGYCSSATGNNSFADGSGCDASGSESVAMGWGCRTAHHSSGGRQIAVGNQCYAEGSQSVAMGHACYTGANAAVAMGYDCSAQGEMSFAMGEYCGAMANTTVALGSSAIATGQLTGSRSTAGGGGPVDISNVFFVYRSVKGNSIEFVDKTATNAGTSADFGSNIGLRYRTADGSASDLIFAAPAGSASLVSLRTAYAGAGQSAVAWGTLTSFATSFPALPNDTRLISVTAWTLGDGFYCGGGVTFNIPSSELRTWYWGLNNVASTVGGYQFRVWNSVNGGTVVGTEQGFQWTGHGSVTGVGTSWPAGGGTGGATDIKYWFAPALNTATQGGSYCVPGASVVSVFPVQSKLWTESDSIPGIKIQWIG